MLRVIPSFPFQFNRIALLLFPFAGMAQGEFVVEINRVSGHYIKTGPAIDPVTFIYPGERSYIQSESVYILPTATPTALYSIDVNDGSVLASPGISNLSQFEYSDILQTLVAMEQSGGVKTLVHVDRFSGNYAAVGPSTPAGLYQGFSSFDQEQNRYIYLGPPSVLYTLDAATGAEIFSPALQLQPGEFLVHFEYDHTDNTVYGLLQDNNQGLWFLCRVDSETGAIERIGAGTAYGIGNGSSTIDEAARQYIYLYYDNGYHITSLNINTGLVVHHAIATMLDPGDNLFNLEYDFSEQRLFSIHWDSLIEAEDGQWRPTASPPAGSVWNMCANGNYAFGAATNGGVYRSTDGEVWAAVNNGINGTSVRAIASNGSRIYVAGANDGRVYTSDNDGDTWTEITPDGMNDVRCLAASGSTVMAGGSDGMRISADEGASWVEPVLPPSNDWIRALLIRENDLFAGTYGGGVFRSTDGGNTWTYSGLNGVYIETLTDLNGHVFAGSISGTEGVYRSSDDGGTWSAVSNGIGFSLNAPDNRNVYALIPEGDAIYAGVEGAGGFNEGVPAVYRSLDLGENWEEYTLCMTCPNVRSFVFFNSEFFAGTDCGIYQRGLCGEGLIPGCTDPGACNYEPLAAIENGSCTYPEEGLDCQGNCLNDSDNDGICDVFETPGCTDPDAVNYQSCATMDDGSCIYLIPGCVYTWAENYNPLANWDDGSCLFEPCGEGTYWDAEAFKCLPLPDTCPPDLNGDSIINTADLLLLLAVFGSICD